MQKTRIGGELSPSLFLKNAITIESITPETKEKIWYSITQSRVWWKMDSYDRVWGGMVSYDSLKAKFFAEQFYSVSPEHLHPSILDSNQNIWTMFDRTTNSYQYVFLNDEYMTLSIKYLVFRWKDYQKLKEQLNQQWRIFTRSIHPQPAMTPNSLIMPVDDADNDMARIFYNTMVEASARVSPEFLEYLRLNGRLDTFKYSNATFSFRCVTLDGSFYSTMVATILTDLHFIVVLIALRLQRDQEKIDLMYQHEKPKDLCSLLKTMKLPKTYKIDRWKSFINLVLSDEFLIAETANIHSLDGISAVTITQMGRRRMIKISVRDPIAPLSYFKRFQVILQLLFHEMTHILHPTRCVEKDDEEKDAEDFNCFDHDLNFYETFSWLVNIGIEENIIPPEFKNVDIFHYNSFDQLPHAYQTCPLSIEYTPSLEKPRNPQLERYYRGLDFDYPPWGSIIQDGSNITWKGGFPKFLQLDDDRSDMCLAISTKMLSEMRRQTERYEGPIQLPDKEFLLEWQQGNTKIDKFEKYKLDSLLSDIQKNQKLYTRK